MSIHRIVLPPGSALPLRTAAAELKGAGSASIDEQAAPARIAPGEVVLIAGDEARRYAPAAMRLNGVKAGEEWELVQRVDGGLLIAGQTPRNVCRAAMAWVENPAAEEDRLSTYRFQERFTMWDNSMNQMYRFSRGFDRARHIREIARLGHTGVEINRYADPGGYHVLHRKSKDDSYAWYLSYAPALDAFVESSLTRGIYRPEELAANLSDLKEAAEIARKYGLKPGFVTYEPRCVAEEIFDRHPQLRGSRTDHPGRSLQPRYAMDIANKRVLGHYAEMLTRLMEHLPDLRYFVFWTQDSGSGLPFANRLYPGPNGSFLARSKTLEEMAAEFTGTLLDAGRKINPEFEVIMEINHEYTDDERRNILRRLPRGVTVSHPIGGSYMEDAGIGNKEAFVRDDREAGIEPYGLVNVATGFDPEPIVGLPAPGFLLRKFGYLDTLKLRRIFSEEGLYSPPQCPFNINQELYAELIRNPVPDLESFLHKTALHWCDGDLPSASALVRAWQVGDQAIASWPKLNWYHAGPGQTQARWLTRPLVPDITLLTPQERSAWERALFTLPWDVGRVNIAFEGGIRFFRDEDMDRAIRAYDEKMIPGLEQAISILDAALARHELPVLEDQRDRYRGMLLRSRTDRNLFDAQVAINNHLLHRGNRDAERNRLKQAIRMEIQNTSDWIQLLTESRIEFFHVTTRQETPFLHITPVEDLKLKLSVMPKHIDDEPGPDIEEVRVAKKELLFSAEQ